MNIKKIVRLTNRLSKELDKGIYGVSTRSSYGVKVMDIHVSLESLLQLKSLDELNVEYDGSDSYPYELSYTVGSTKVFALAQTSDYESIKSGLAVNEIE